MRKALPRASMKVRFTPIKEGVMEEKIDKVSTLLKEASEILKTQPSGATPRNTPQPTTDSMNRYMYSCLHVVTKLYTQIWKAMLFVWMIIRNCTCILPA